MQAVALSENKYHAPRRSTRAAFIQEELVMRIIEGFMNILALLVIGVVLWAIGPILIKILTLLSGMHGWF